MRALLIVLGLAGTLVAGATAQSPGVWTLSADATVLGRGADEEFEYVRRARLLRDGGAVITDAGGLFVRKYDSTGAAVWSFGREGDGPAEFRTISGVWETPIGEVGVWDGRTRRLTIIGNTGTLAQTALVTTTPLPGNLELFFGACDNGDVILGSLDLRAPRAGEVVTELWHLARFSPDGVMRVRLGHVEGMQRMYRAPLPFSPVSWIGLRRDTLLIVEGYQDALQLTADASSSRRRIRVPLRAPDLRSARPALEQQLRQRQRHFYLDLLREAPPVENLPRVGGLVIDREGRAWIKEYDPARDAIWLKRNALDVAPGGTWHILDERGSVAARMTLPDDFLLLDVANGRVLGVEHDELDVQRVVIRRILR